MIEKINDQILIVDDQQNWRNTLEDILGDQYSIVLANSYQDAISKLENHDPPFHVAIVDLRLDDRDPNNEDGLLFIEALNKVSRFTNAIVVTGHPSVKTVTEAFRDLEVFDYIEKVPEGDETYLDDYEFFLKKFRQTVKNAIDACKEKRANFFVNETQHMLQNGVELNNEKILELFYRQINLLIDVSHLFVIIALYEGNPTLEDEYNPSHPTASVLHRNLSLAFVSNQGEIVDINSLQKIDKYDIVVQLLQHTILIKKLYYPKNSQTIHDVVTQKQDVQVPKSWLSIPLMIKDRVLGIVALCSNQFIRDYSEQEIEQMQELANKVAMTLKRPITYEQMAEEIVDLENTQVQIADGERYQVINSLAADLIHRMNNSAWRIPNRVTMVKKLLEDQTMIDWDKQVKDQLDKIIEDTKTILQETHELISPQFQAEYVDLVDLINSIIAEMELVTPSNVEFSVNRGKRKIPPIRAIKPQLSNAIYNVIDNSIKAVDGKGKVSIKLNLQTNHIKPFVNIVITDTGHGIPENKINTVFDLGVTDQESGFGYGLWRSRDIIRRIGGQINVKSRVGKGSTFNINLPIETADVVA